MGARAGEGKKDASSFAFLTTQFLFLKKQVWFSTDFL